MRRVGLFVVVVVALEDGERERERRGMSEIWGKEKQKRREKK